MRLHRKKIQPRRKKEENQVGDDKEIVHIANTDRADAMSVENVTEVNVCVYNISDYHQSDLFVRTARIADPDIPLHVVSLLHVTSQHAPFCIYCFAYTCGTVSVMFYRGMSAEDVNTPSTGCMTVGRQVLNNGAEVLLLDERHCVEAK